MAFPQFEVMNETVEMDIARTLTAAGNGINLVVTDTSTIATGRERGLYIEYTSSGTKTGDAGVRTMAIDTTISADVPTWTGIDMYLAALGGDNNYTVGVVTPLSIYVGDLGDNIDSFMAIDIGINSSAASNSRHCYIRCREHTAPVSNSAIMRLEGLNAAAYFLIFDNPALTEDSAVILDEATCDQYAAGDYRIRCHLEQYGIDRYLYLFPI